MDEIVVQNRVMVRRGDDIKKAIIEDLAKIGYEIDGEINIKLCNQGVWEGIDWMQYVVKVKRLNSVGNIDRKK